MFGGYNEAPLPGGQQVAFANETRMMLNDGLFVMHRYAEAFLRFFCSHYITFW